MASHKFFITLPSNVKSPSYHVNIPSHFITNLASPLHLPNNEYEVALVEVSFPLIYHNVYFEIGTFYVRFTTADGTSVKETLHIPEQWYRSVVELAEGINKQFPSSFKGRLAIKGAGARRRVNMMIYDLESIKFHPTVANMLGFDRHVLKFDFRNSVIDKAGKVRVTRHAAERDPNIRASLFNVYIYTNIVEDQIVGNQLVPLLRTISFEGKSGEYVHKIFDSPHYLNLSTDTIQHIEVKLATDLGSLIHFETGKVIVKLHFRKKHFWL